MPICYDIGMQKIILGLAVMVLFTGCSRNNNLVVPTVDPTVIFQKQLQALDTSLSLESELRNLFTNADSVVPASTYTYPMQQYTTLRTKLVFGQYVSPNSGDRFSGYHTGDDIEVTDVTTEVPFFALTSATVLRKETVSGYGGVLILEFTEGATTYQAFYGHVDLNSITAVVGDTVQAGDQLGVLGDDASSETDGERKHLHFAIYPSSGTVLYAGYISSDADLQQWLNPSDFLRTAKAVEPV